MKPFLRTFSLVLAAVVLAFGCMSLPTGAVGAVMPLSPRPMTCLRFPTAISSAERSTAGRCIPPTAANPLSIK